VSATTIRCTVVDAAGTISFVAPAHVLKALVAACGHGAADHRALLDSARRYDPDFIGGVINGLAVFDEHNTDDEHGQIHAQLAVGGEESPPFRVVDSLTREASLAPVGAGRL